MKHSCSEWGLILLLAFCEATLEELCDNLQCEDEPEGPVCGVRWEVKGVRLRLFESQCELLKYGCSHREDQAGIKHRNNNKAIEMGYKLKRVAHIWLKSHMCANLKWDIAAYVTVETAQDGVLVRLKRLLFTAYGIINMEHCNESLNISNAHPEGKLIGNFNVKKPVHHCVEYDCSYPGDDIQVCGIRNDGSGFRVRLFKNKCQLIKHNCENNLNFTITELNYCDGVAISEDTVAIVTNVTKPVFVIDASMFNQNKNMNETIENFFAATHLLNLPVVDAQRTISESSRRMMIKIFGPRVVYQPWITIPKNISEDYYHRPTLSSCFHKCPTKCPETYAPVCGVPGIVAREPSLMFQNHCFMDVAQCKMHWEDKSPTAESSYYIESSFVFCVGDQMSGMFRFLPVIRTLQHMGRMRKHGRFRYRLNNLRFLNNLLPREPNLMG